MFDEVSCEEYYGEDLWAAFCEGMREEANFELQEIADEQKAASVGAEWDAFFFELFSATELAA